MKNSNIYEKIIIIILGFFLGVMITNILHTNSSSPKKTDTSTEIQFTNEMQEACNIYSSQHPEVGIYFLHKHMETIFSLTNINYPLEKIEYNQVLTYGRLAILYEEVKHNIEAEKYLELALTMAKNSNADLLIGITNIDELKAFVNLKCPRKHVKN